MRPSLKLPALMALYVFIFSAACTFADELTAEQLIAKVVDARKTTGFRARAKLTLFTSGFEKRDVRQLLIKGRLDGEATKTLYQVLWPASSAGQTLLVEKSARHTVSGFFFEPPDKVTSLSPQLMKRPFFGSDLTIEDMTEDFWHWPSQKIVGEEILETRPCKIIESRPAEGADTSYSLVKTWVWPDAALPLRVQKFDKDGRPVKTFTVGKLVKHADRWAATILTVEPAGEQTRTTLEVSRGERGLAIPADDFTLDKIKASLRLPP